MNNKKVKIILASHNNHKVAEIQELLSGTGIHVKSLSDMGYHKEIIEDGNTLQENALIKARTLYKKYDCPVIGEDTGLEIYALDMAPGVYTARYAGADKDPKKNMTRVLNELKDTTHRNARFRTAIALIWEGKEYLMEGIVEGKIAEEISGTGGFGYDPIFIPDGHKKTFGELPSATKQKISHRSRAINKLINKINQLMQN